MWGSYVFFVELGNLTKPQSEITSNPRQVKPFLSDPPPRAHRSHLSDAECDKPASEVDWVRKNRKGKRMENGPRESKGQEWPKGLFCSWYHSFSNLPVCNQVSSTIPGATCCHSRRCHSTVSQPAKVRSFGLQRSSPTSIRIDFERQKERPSQAQIRPLPARQNPNVTLPASFRRTFPLPVRTSEIHK